MTLGDYINEALGGVPGEKILLDEIIRKYPDGITLCGIYRGLISEYDNAGAEVQKMIPYYKFVEEPDKYFGGSGDFVKIYEYLLNKFDNDFQAVQQAFLIENVKVKIEKIPTAARRTYTRVTYIKKVPVEAVIDENDMPF